MGMGAGGVAASHSGDPVCGVTLEIFFEILEANSFLHSGILSARAKYGTGDNASRHRFILKLLNLT